MYVYPQDKVDHNTFLESEKQTNYSQCLLDLLPGLVLLNVSEQLTCFRDLFCPVFRTGSESEELNKKCENFLIFSLRGGGRSSHPPVPGGGNVLQAPISNIKRFPFQCFLIIFFLVLLVSCFYTLRLLQIVLLTSSCGAGRREGGLQEERYFIQYSCETIN